MLATRFFLFVAAVLLCSSCSVVKNFEASDFGIKPVKNHNNSPYIQKALTRISKESKTGEKTVLIFEPGTYEFMRDSAVVREYYISYHDQTNPKITRFDLKNIHKLTLDENGANLFFMEGCFPSQ